MLALEMEDEERGMTSLMIIVCYTRLEKGGAEKEEKRKGSK